MPDLLHYHYYFNGIKDPLIIQAMNRAEARQALTQFLRTMPELDNYRQSTLDGETVSRPIKGVSTRKINGQSWLWIGYDESPDTQGWKKIDKPTTHAKTKKH